MNICYGTRPCNARWLFQHNFLLLIRCDYWCRSKRQPVQMLFIWYCAHFGCFHIPLWLWISNWYRDSLSIHYVNLIHCEYIMFMHLPLHTSWGYYCPEGWEYRIELVMELPCIVFTFPSGIFCMRISCFVAGCLVMCEWTTWPCITVHILHICSKLISLCVG